MNETAGKTGVIPSTEIWGRRASFTKNYMEITDTRRRKIVFPYKRLVIAYLEVQDEDTGLYFRPQLGQATAETKGNLILYDNRYYRIKIYTGQAEETGGRLWKRLAMEAPYLFLDYMPWMEEGNLKEFSVIREMVSTMRSL